jgi:hypothetical protein
MGGEKGGEESQYHCLRPGVGKRVLELSLYILRLKIGALAIEEMCVQEPNSMAFCYARG